MNQFTKTEQVSARQNILRTLVRFMGTLTLLKKIIVPTIMTMFFASAIPPYFLWFVGEMVACLGDACEVTHSLAGWDLVLPATVSTLLMLVVLAMIFRVASWSLFELAGLWSTQQIQADMMRSISHVRTTFFDENPSGRLINRLIGDYGTLRLDGVMSIGDTTNGLIEVLCVGLLIMLANPIAGLMILPVALLYAGLQSQLAPMMSHAREIRAVKIGETLHRETDLIEGRTLFTLYGKQQNLLERVQHAFGESMNIQLFYCRLFGWGMFWMGMISAAYAVLVYAFLVYGIHAGVITTTLAAVVITAVFNLNSLFIGLSWNMSYMGETASHASRAFFMIDLPHETSQESRQVQVQSLTQADGRQGQAETQPGWAAAEQPRETSLSGDIVFDNYSMSYRPGLPNILDRLSMTLPEGQKAGLVGRTGAGKSSIMQSLFRMVYHQGGDIRIGDESIFSLEVNCLRRHFGVVPQDPYLFAGTIRFNLAGDLDISDDELRQALATVGLEMRLDDTVLEGGRDFSVGERQLLCIARLILLDKRYILMDEPTSALDNFTDEMIQRLMQTELASKTVVTIAHRLESLMHYDLILELGEGRLLSQGTPKEMLPKLRSHLVA